MGIRELRAKYEEQFDAFFEAFPRKIDRLNSFTVFISLGEEGVDLDMVIAKARSFSRNVDPKRLEYCPSPKSWLAGRRWEDSDLFTDERESTRNYLVEAWKAGDAAAVERKFGFIYADPPIPDGVDIQVYCLDSRKAWITRVANHILHDGPPPDDEE